MGAPILDTIRRILSSNPSRTLVNDSLVPAGVMLFLYPKEGEYCVLLSRRTHVVEHHKGEISFPGGRMDEGDETLLDTALRETHEELGVEPRHVEVLGSLDDVATGTGYLISPFVGSIPYPYDFKPSEVEVAEVLDVPLSGLLDERSFRDEVRIANGQLVHYPCYSYNGNLIFGATAKVLGNFLRLIEGAVEKDAPWKRP